MVSQKKYMLYVRKYGIFSPRNSCWELESTLYASNMVIEDFAAYCVKPQVKSPAIQMEQKNEQALLPSCCYSVNSYKELSFFSFCLSKIRRTLYSRALSFLTYSTHTLSTELTSVLMT